ncbi:MAG: DNA mismatch repair endonuclease MutL, partial [Clostridia bacterium]|nr:DNA mismatch repair endonuclease MutL [Clostridia bacterium]
MPKINQLSFEVANLIAAGEVVERPASVVKELMENAVDAGATKITAEIRRGGVGFVSVTDDGCGMEAEDLPVSIRRHATSKIKEAEDLADIGTLGFRGEALAAISAVSTVTIITKTRTAPQGCLLRAVGGRVEEITEVGCADGTAITVEDLFGNVPARRKFLKKDATETAAVLAVMEKIAMSHPEVAIRFVADGVTKFSTPGDGQLLHVLHALYGRDFSSRLLPVEGKVGEIAVTGYIGRPDNAKANRNHQNAFINGRYVKSKTVLAAIERAFTSYMAPERFPVAVLCLSVPGFAVDVNVHPAKLEVKFSDEKQVFEAVYYAIRNTLESDTCRPYMTFGKETKKEEKDFSLTHRFEAGRGEQIKMPPILRPDERASEGMARPTARPVDAPVIEAPAPVSDRTPSPSVSQSFDFDKAFRASSQNEAQKGVLSPEESLRIVERMSDIPRSAEASVTPPPMPEKKEETAISTPLPGTGKIVTPPPKAELPAYRIAGVLFRCYILVELEGEKMLVIDQHAAHERILFEQLKAQKAKESILSRPLLLPLTLRPTAEELAAASLHGEELEALGFSYRVTEDKILLLSIPDATAPHESEGLFLSL